MFHNNAHYYPYPSQRTATFARNGMVATSQPLASQAGLEILKKGGNAIDAAIATAAALTVVEPTSNGIGGDAFAIVWFNNQMYGLNSSGPAPQNISIEKIKSRGFDEIPKYGFIPVTVPGTPKAWAELSKKFGKLPLTEVLAPAIKYAKEGYPLSPTLAYYWELASRNFKANLKEDMFKHWFETFTPNGQAPKVGEIWNSIDHANTLSLIANTNADAFYSGELADKIVAFSNQYDGFIQKSDLESFKVDWVKPIRVNYRGYDVWELPPNGQGIVALMALDLVKEFEFKSRDDVDTLHKQIEAMKLAFTDGLQYIADFEPEQAVNHLLNEEYLSKRRELITTEASMPKFGQPQKGGTVYLATADSEGNMVSYIQSNYMGFGSGLVVPGTGIALHNRGHNFTLDENHLNALQPGKRPYHTIIPGFLTKDNDAIGPFGVMGGFMQPQGHMQVIMNTIDFGLNPQAALDAPRWQWMKDKQITVEQSMPNHVIKGLADIGHQLKVEYNSGSFGRGQIIWRNKDTGVLVGGTESRADGSIACY